MLSVDSNKPGLARLSPVVNFFSSWDAGTTIKPSMTALDLRTVSVLERLRRRRKTGKTVKTGIYPRPRKYPPEYPRPGLSKSPAISRTYEKYPQYPQYPRDVGDAYGSAHTHIHKETLNFTLLIYICLNKPNPWHPQMRGDFGDIGDIFRKPSNHAGLQVFEFGDILGMSPWDGDVPEGRGCVVSCTQRRIW